MAANKRGQRAFFEIEIGRRVDSTLVEALNQFLIGFREGRERRAAAENKTMTREGGDTEESKRRKAYRSSKAR